MSTTETHIDQAFWPIPKRMRKNKIQPAIDSMNNHWPYLKVYIREGRRMKAFKRQRSRFVIIASLYDINKTDMFNFGIEFGENLKK